MTLCGLESLDYKREDQLLSILFTEGDVETYENLDLSTIEVATDTGLVVETFHGFTELMSITKNLATGNYTVVCRIPTTEETAVKELSDWSQAQISLLQASNQQLATENVQLNAKLAAAIQSNAMLEDCLVEMAGIVYA